ncbi:fibronectin type III domain-containing protein [Thermodesulfobacteriota bacterium]
MSINKMERGWGVIMRASRFVLICLLFFIFLFSAGASAENQGTGAIIGKIVLESDPNHSGSHEDVRTPLSRHKLGGGDAGGCDSGGGGAGGDGGYLPFGMPTPQNIQRFTLIDAKDRIMKLENLVAGNYNLIMRFQDDLNEEFQLTLKNIRVLEGQVTDLKELLLKKGGAISGQISYQGSSEFPAALVHVVDFYGFDSENLPAWLNERITTTTGSDGSFILNNLPAGTYVIGITPTDVSYAPDVITNVWVDPDAETNATPFGPLEIKSAVGVLKSKVKLEDMLIHGGPYNGTFVRATSEEGRYRSYIQFTNETGEYDFGNIPTGNYTLHVSHDDYKIRIKAGVKVDPGSISSPEIIYLEPGTRKICGRVLVPGGGLLGDLNDNDELDLGDAILAHKILSGRPTNGFYLADVDGDEKIGASEGLYILQVIAGLRLAAGSLAGSLVMVSGTNLMAVTDVQGRFSIDGVPENEINTFAYDLIVMRTGYQAFKKETVTAQTACSFDTITINLIPNETVLVGELERKTGSITGQTWLKNDADHSTIDIAIDNTGFNTKPNGNGLYVFSGIPPGTYTLRYSNPDYKTVIEFGVLVVENETAEVRNVLLVPKNGSVKGRVTLEDATNFGGIPIKVEPNEAQVPDFSTDSMGYYNIPVPENFNPIDNVKCVLDYTPSGSGGCTAYNSYRIVIGGGEWAHTEYVEFSFENVDVPAGEEILRSDVELSKPPDAPTGLTASQSSGSSITVEWTASTADDVIGYNIYYSTQSDTIDQKANTALIDAQIDEKWQYEVTGLEKGTVYYFGTKAFDDDDLESVLSQYVSKGIVPTPSIPAIVNTVDNPFVFPEAICLDRNGVYGYVTNPFNNVVSLISLATSTVLGLIAVGTTPVDLAANPLRDEVYCVNGESHRITIIDSTQENPNQAVITELLTGPYPKRCLVSPDGEYLFVSYTGAQNDGITVIDLNTRASIQGSPIQTLDDPTAMAIANGKLYVINGEIQTRVLSVVDIDPQSDNYLQTFYTINAGQSPEDVIASPSGDVVYVADAGANTLIVIDTLNGQRIDPPLQVSDYPYRMAVHGSMLYVTNYSFDNGVLFIVKMDTYQVLPAPIIVGAFPKGIAVTNDGETIYVVHENSSGSVSIWGY